MHSLKYLLTQAPHQEWLWEWGSRTDCAHVCLYVFMCVQGIIASEEEDLPVAVEETFSGETHRQTLSLLFTYNSATGMCACVCVCAFMLASLCLCMCVCVCVSRDHLLAACPDCASPASGSGSGNYIVVFDPLDGSSNIDAGISVGSIFGIYEPSEQCPLDAMDDPNKMMVRAHSIYVHVIVKAVMWSHTNVCASRCSTETQEGCGPQLTSTCPY